MAKIKFRTPRQKAKEFCEHLRRGKDSKGQDLSDSGAAYRAGYVDGRGETLTSISYAQARRDGKLAAWKQKQKPFNDRRKERQKQSRKRKADAKEIGSLYQAYGLSVSDQAQREMEVARRKGFNRAISQGATHKAAMLRGQRAAIEAAENHRDTKNGVARFPGMMLPKRRKKK